METSKTTSNTSNASSTSNTPAVEKEKKKTVRKQKQKKLKRSKDSFRPGKAASATVVKTLNFIIPGTGITNDQERVAVNDLAVQSSKAAGVEVNAVDFHDQAWEIVLKLQPVEGEDDDDKLVSDAFRKLDDTINASAVLQKGFQPVAPPRWEFKNGDFVADEDLFKRR